MMPFCSRWKWQVDFVRKKRYLVDDCLSSVSYHQQGNTTNNITHTHTREFFETDLRGPSSGINSKYFALRRLDTGLFSTSTTTKCKQTRLNFTGVLLHVHISYFSSRSEMP